jgi:hypothetical protein
VALRGPAWLTIGRLEVVAVALAAAAGLYSLATSDQASVRLAIVVLAPMLEAALPLAARVVAPGRRHAARVIAALLVSFYVAFAPIGIDNYVYLPAVVVLLAVIVMSNRERWREIRSRGDARR